MAIRLIKVWPGPALNKIAEPINNFDVSDIFAVVIQHEIDHLNGRVFIAYLPKLRRDIIRQKNKRVRFNK